MEKTYVLEFNEKQQAFHLNDGTSPIGSNGWEPIIDTCTHLESEVFDAFVLSKMKSRIYTVDFLIQCADEISTFWKELLNKNISIKFS